MMDPTSLETLRSGLLKCHKAGALSHVNAAAWAKTHNRQPSEIEDLIAGIRLEEAMRSPIEAEGD